MKYNTRKLIRSLLIYVPFIGTIKPKLQRSIHRLLRIPFEKELRALRLLQLRQNDLLLDVGANEGFAIDAFLLQKEKYKIIAFEPRQDLFAQLTKRYKNLPEITILPFGLGESNGEHQLFTPAYRSFVFHPLSSFLREHADSWLRHNEIYGFNERDYRILESVCTIRRLDDLNIKPSFIKIDVQGYELQVLKGGEQTIRTALPVIFIGTVRDEQHDYLRQFGYHHYIFDSPSDTLQENPGNQPNSFFIPDTKLPFLLPTSGISRFPNADVVTK